MDERTGVAGEGAGTGDDAARNARLLKTGVAGTVIATVCCFTPLLAVLFGAAGISAWLGYADYVLFPVLGLFVALTGYALVRRRSCQSPCLPKKEDHR